MTALPLNRFAAEMFVRPAAREGTFMVCGYAARAFERPESVYTLAGFDLSALVLMAEAQEPRFPIEPAASIAAAVTAPIFSGARKGAHAVVLQIVPRKVLGQPDLTMFAGVLQDLDGMLDGVLPKTGAVMLDGSALPTGRMELRATDTDMAWSRGHTLEQVLTTPIWSLGAPELWAAAGGMREDIEQASAEAREIRGRTLAGQALPEDAARAKALYQITGGTISPVGRDYTFDRFEKAMAKAGEEPPARYAGILTASDLADLSARAEHAVELMHDPLSILDL